MQARCGPFARKETSLDLKIYYDGWQMERCGARLEIEIYLARLLAFARQLVVSEDQFALAIVDIVNLRRYLARAVDFWLKAR